jgi:hypothetical protein
VEREDRGEQRELHRLEHESERVDEHIREAREDWEQKERDRGVPGAQPPDGEESS